MGPGRLRQSEFGRAHPESVEASLVSSVEVVLRRDVSRHDVSEDIPNGFVVVDDARLASTASVLGHAPAGIARALRAFI
jgi:hypothetical protein